MQPTLLGGFYDKDIQDDTIFLGGDVRGVLPLFWEVRSSLVLAANVALLASITHASTLSKHSRERRTLATIPRTGCWSCVARNKLVVQTSVQLPFH